MDNRFDFRKWHLRVMTSISYAIYILLSQKVRVKNGDHFEGALSKKLMCIHWFYPSNGFWTLITFHIRCRAIFTSFVEIVATPETSFTMPMLINLSSLSRMSCRKWHLWLLHHTGFPPADCNIYKLLCFLFSPAADTVRCRSPLSWITWAKSS